SCRQRLDAWVLGIPEQPTRRLGGPSRVAGWRFNDRDGSVFSCPSYYFCLLGRDLRGPARRSSPGERRSHYGFGLATGLKNRRTAMQNTWKTILLLFFVLACVGKQALAQQTGNAQQEAIRK